MKTKKIPWQILSKLLAYISVVLYLIFVISGLNKPPVKDEAIFMKVVDGLNKGILYLDIYRGGEDFNLKECYPIWHIPTWLLLLTAYTRIFGLSFISIRSFAFLFNIFSLVLVYLITKELFGKRNMALAYLSIFFYTITPFAVSGSLLIENDNTVLNFVLLSFVFLFIWIVKKSKDLRLKNKYLLGLGLMFGLSLLVKETTPILLPPVVLSYYILKGKFKLGIVYSIVIALIGIFIMLSIWYVATTVYNLDFNCIFKWQASVSSTFFLKPLYILNILQILSFRLSPAFFVLIHTTSLFFFFKLFSKHKRDECYFLLIYGLLVLILYTIILPSAPYGYPRYHYVLLAPFSILIAYWVSGVIRPIKLKQCLLGVVILFLLIIYYTSLLKDPFTITPRLGYNLGDVALVSAIYFAPVILLSFIFNKKYQNHLAFYVVVLLLATSIYINGIHILATFDTIYDYGSYGLEETVKFVKNNVSPDETIISPPDVAIYSNQPFFSVSRHHMIVKNFTAFEDTILKYNVRYAIIDEYILAGLPNQLNYAIEKYPNFKIGTFIVLNTTH